MKIIFYLLLLAFVAVIPVFSQDAEADTSLYTDTETEKKTDVEFTVYGEIKTGIYYEKYRVLGDVYTHAKMHNNDGDSGMDEGRIRIGLGLKVGNFGMRMQFKQSSFKATDSSFIDYAYAYGNLVKDQIKISAGLLGESPWNTGGPDIIKELEFNNSPLMGIRTELKPTFVSWLKGLNIGFVLGMDNDNAEIGAKEKFADLFLDAVAGIKWDHEYFLISFAYRFSRPTFSAAAQQGGEQFIYRVEERALRLVAPGLQIFANGWCQGILPDKYGEILTRGLVIDFTNWFYIRYDIDILTAGVDMRYQNTLENGQRYFEIRPRFFYKFFDDFFSLGVVAGIEFGFEGGRERTDGSIFNFWYIEPQARLNINSNCYVAAVYRYLDGINKFRRDKLNFEADQNTHIFNLRIGFSF